MNKKVGLHPVYYSFITALVEWTFLSCGRRFFPVLSRGCPSRHSIIYGPPNPRVNPATTDGTPVCFSWPFCNSIILVWLFGHLKVQLQIRTTIALWIYECIFSSTSKCLWKKSVQSLNKEVNKRFVFRTICNSVGYCSTPVTIPISWLSLHLNFVILSVFKTPDFVQ